MKSLRAMSSRGRLEGSQGRPLARLRGLWLPFQSLGRQGCSGSMSATLVRSKQKGQAGGNVRVAGAVLAVSKFRRSGCREKERTDSKSSKIFPRHAYASLPSFLSKDNQPGVVL
jgi:hypothetical protein